MVAFPSCVAFTVLRGSHLYFKYTFGNDSPKAILFRVSAGLENSWKALNSTYKSLQQTQSFPLATVAQKFILANILNESKVKYVIFEH